MTAIAAWVSAAGTIAAALVALGLFASSITDRRRAQARLVSAWASHRYWLLEKGKSSAIRVKGTRPLDPGSPIPADIPADESLGVTARDITFAMVSWYVANASEEAISQVDCAFIGQRYARSEYQLPHKTEWFTYLRSLPGRHLHDGVQTLHADEWEGVSMNGLVVRVCFTDAAGRRWERTTSQPLRRLDGWRCRTMVRLRLVAPLNPTNRPVFKDPEGWPTHEEQTQLGADLRTVIGWRAPWRMSIDRRRNRIRRRWRQRRARALGE